MEPSKSMDSLSHHRNKLSKLAYVRQFHIFQKNCTTFVFVSLFDISDKSRIEEFNSSFEFETELILLPKLPINIDGEVAESELLSTFSLATARQLNDFANRISTDQREISFERVVSSCIKLRSHEEDQTEDKKSANNKFSVAETDLTDYQTDKNYSKSNLLKYLLSTAEKYPEKGILHIDKNGKDTFTSYPDLLIRAQIVASAIEMHTSNDNVIIALEDHGQFFVSLWAGIISRKISIPISASFDASIENSATNKFYNTCRLLNSPTIITSESKKDDFVKLEKLYPDLSINLIIYDELLNKSENINRMPIDHTIPSNTTAYYQLTSGSTGNSKYIIEKHNNIILHAISSAKVNKHSKDDVSLNWISTDHVVPILSYHFRDVCLGCQQIHVDSSLVIHEPLSWFELIDRYSVSITWAPNFAYRLLTEAAKNKIVTQYSLKTIRQFMNAGEQVTRPVMEDFENLLKKMGIDSSVIQPAYGMAETSTCITYNNNYSSSESYIKPKFNSNGERLNDAGTSTNNYEYADLGSPIPGCEIRIIEETGKQLPDLHVGMLQVRGPLLAGGYHQGLESIKTFPEDRWFTTGDLAFIWQSRLFVTGREKEVMIIRGNNFHCYELEECINRVAGVKNTFSAATSMRCEKSGTEELVVFYVHDEYSNQPHNTVRGNVISDIARDFGISPKYTVAIPYCLFPKTSGGKIQRKILKKQFEGGQFDWLLNRGRDKADDHLAYSATRWLERGNTPSLTAKRYEKNRQFIKPAIWDNTIDYPSVCKMFKELNSANSIVVYPYLYFKPFAPNDGDKIEQKISNLAEFIKSCSNHKHIESILIILPHVYQVHSGDAAAGAESGWILGLINSWKKEIDLPNICLLDIEKLAIGDAISTINNEILLGLKDELVAYRNKTRYVFTLEQRSTQALAPKVIKGQTYLLVGGSGSVGLILAKHLVNTHGANVILTGQRSKNLSYAAQEYLAGALANIEYIQYDSTKADSTNSTFRNISPRINCVVYLAGTLKQQSFHSESYMSGYDSILQKSATMIDIIECFREADLKPKYIVFSSVTSLIGASEYSAYAASNSLCESIAAMLKKKYCSDITVVSWPLWLETKMAQHFDYEKIEHSLDFELFDTPKALRYFDWCLNNQKSGIYLGLRNDKYNIQKWIHNIKFSDYFELHVTGSDLPVSTIRNIQDTALLNNGNAICRIKPINSNGANMIHPKNNDMEFHAIDQLWRNSLGIRSTNYNLAEGYFSLGGNSLSAIKLMMDIQKTFNIQISMSDLISCEGLNGLYQYIFEQRQFNYGEKTEVFEPAARFPLSIIQKQILYQCLLGENAAYNVYKIFRVSGPIEHLKANACFEAIIKDFPIINARLVCEEGEYNQDISQELNQEYITYSNCESEEEAINTIQDDIRRPFNLYSNSTLYRIKQISISNSIHFLLFNFHHLICDEWSLNMLFKRFSELYEGTNRNYKRLDYSYFVKDQKVPAKPSTRFMQQLERYQPIFSNRSKHIKAQAGSIYTQRLAQKDFIKIKEVAISENVTPAILFHAVLNIALYMKHDSPKFNIGVPITFRSKNEHRNMFGLLVNTSVIGYKDEPNLAMKEYINTVKKKYLLAQENQNVPFSNLLSECYSKGICCRSGLPFEVLFVYEDFINRLSTSSFTTREIILHNDTCKFPLTIALKFLQENSPVLQFEYSKALFSDADIEALSCDFLTLLNRLPTLPDLNLSVSSYRVLGRKS